MRRGWGRFLVTAAQCHYIFHLYVTKVKNRTEKMRDNMKVKREIGTMRMRSKEIMIKMKMANKKIKNKNSGVQKKKKKKNHITYNKFYFTGFTKGSKNKTQPC